MRFVTAALLFWSLAFTAASGQETFEIRAAEIRQKDVRAEGVLLLPVQARPLRSVVVLLNWGLGRDAFLDPRWRTAAAQMDSALLLARFGDQNLGSVQVPAEEQVNRNASLGGAAALLDLLDHLAEQTGRAELRTVPLAIWGFSAAGGFALSFGEANPERTLAVVRYHSHRRGLPVDVGKVAQVPALLVAGGADQRAGTEDAHELWREGLKAGASWTFLVEPGRRHADGLDAATPFMLAWLKGVAAARLAQPKGPLINAHAWVGDLKTGRILPIAEAPGSADRGDATWLPDRTAADAWQRIVTTPRK